MTTTHRPVGYARPALLGELAVVFGLVFAYDRIRNLAQSRPVPSATDGARILDLERLLHLDIERWLNLWLSGHETIAVVASWYYQLLHLSVTMTVLLACYVCRPDVYRAARNALVSISVIGLMIFWVFPVAPPRLLPGGGYVDTAVATGVVGLVDSASANPYAAMPSLHLAWAVWSVMFASVLISRRSMRWLLYAYPVVTTIDVMATANHYLLDAVVGAVLALLAGRVCLMRHALVSTGREQQDDSDVTLTDSLQDPAALRLREPAGKRQPYPSGLGTRLTEAVRCCGQRQDDRRPLVDDVYRDRARTLSCPDGDRPLPVPERVVHQHVEDLPRGCERGTG